MLQQKVSEYFQIIKPHYIYLKITPDNSIRNYSSPNIAKAIHYMGRGIMQRIEKQQRKFVYKSPVKCSYIIDITKHAVDFTLMVPEQYVNIAREKIRETWPKVKVSEAQMNPLSAEAKTCQLHYKNQDALSLDTDKTNNEPLNHLLNVVEIMDDTDRIVIAYNFMPVNQYGWSMEYENTMQLIQNGQRVTKRMTGTKIVIGMGNFAFYLLETMLGAITSVFGGESKTDVLDNLRSMLGMVKKGNDLSLSTRHKKNDIVINTQLLVIGEGKNKDVNTQATCQAFRSIEGDNRLVYKPAKHVGLEKYNWKIIKNTMSVAECQNLIQLPGRALLDEFKQIERIDVLETPVPDQLSRGVIRLGVNTYRGLQTKVYTTEDRELSNTAVCICGPNRSGKSTLIANNVYDLINAGRTVILPDFCGRCQLSDELAQAIPKNKIINIDCSDITYLQGFGWNEIQPKDNTMFEIYKTAKMKASKLKELINLVNDGSSDLEGRMERYLEYAALVVFICNGSVNEVFRTLKEHNLRHQYIHSVPEELKPEMIEYVQELLELDEYDKQGQLVGTKQGHISAILSRIHRLKQNAYIELMLKRDTKDNINLVKELQGGKLICLRMKDDMFVTHEEKDIYVSYWLTKIWGALQQRFCNSSGDLKQVVLLIDELYQVKNSERYLTSILSQMPKYRAKLVLSCHHLAQIDVIQEELKSALCSYVFLRGSNKKNFYSMREEFEDKGFSLEDMLHLKRYHALNLLAFEDGYWCGITQLPKPIT